jgi:hypothetical protein
MVNLARYHEEEGEQVNWDNRESQTFPSEPVQNEGHHMHYKEIKASPDFDGIGIDVFVLHKLYYSIIG